MTLNSTEAEAEQFIEKVEENNQTDTIVNDQREKIEEVVEEKMNGEELDVGLDATP